MKDKTNYFQSVVHILKGNIGAGILSMPLSFKHLGYAGASIALPLMCVISAYCVHVLVRSSRRISKRLNDYDLNYSVLAKRSFELGPNWLNGSGKLIGSAVDTALLVTQIGVCCIYIIFVVDNVTSILASYHIHISQMATFLAILPFAILLSCIRTLNRLAIASLVANMLQVVGLILIIEYLVRDYANLSLRNRRAFTPINEMALGFGSVMFAFEGISVVLPVYNRIKKREQFGSLCGVINVSFLVILVLDFIVGFLGYMKYGADTKDSITLNLPAEPLYDAVRAMFTISILLSYPLQFYVPNQIIWDWSKKNLIKKPTSWHPREITMDDTKDAASFQGLNAIATPKSLEAVDNKEISVPYPVAALDATSLARDNITFQGLTSVPNKGANDIMTRPFHKELTQQDSVSMSFNSQAELVNSSTSGSSTSDTSSENGDDIPLRYEYYCRLCLVLTTFTLAISVPKLNLLMDFIGSFSGVVLCLTVPAMIHMAAYWGTLRGFKKCSMIIIDSSIAILSLVAGFHGSFSSLMAIIGGYHPQLQ